MAGADAPRPETLAFSIAANSTSPPAAKKGKEAVPKAAPKRKASGGTTRKEEAFNLTLGASTDTFDLAATASQMGIKPTTVLGYICEWIAFNDEEGQARAEISLAQAKALRAAIRADERAYKKFWAVWSMLDGLVGGS
jgi:hypothetical protein